MKVVDWDKWQKAKAMLAGVSALVALGFMGGLEAQPGDAEPRYLWVLTFLGITGLLIYNIWKRDQQRGKRW